MFFDIVTLSRSVLLSGGIGGMESEFMPEEHDGFKFRNCTQTLILKLQLFLAGPTLMCMSGNFGGVEEPLIFLPYSYFFFFFTAPADFRRTFLTDQGIHTPILRPSQTTLVAELRRSFNDNPVLVIFTRQHELPTNRTKLYPKPKSQWVNEAARPPWARPSRR